MRGCGYYDQTYCLHWICMSDMMVKGGFCVKISGQWFAH